jgi:hypothetical protein
MLVTSSRGWTAEVDAGRPSANWVGSPSASISFSVDRAAEWTDEMIEEYSQVKDRCFVDVNGFPFSYDLGPRRCSAFGGDT